MIKQEFRGASGILLPGAITIPKGLEIAISQDWLIFPEAITGEGKVWTIDGLLEPCIKLDNEVWVDSNVENPFSEPIIYKGKNKYGWLIGEIPEDVTNELDYINRKSVRNIILSNYVTEIPDKAFFNCYDLQHIIISNSVLRIGYDAFWYCSSLTSITIPNSVTSIGDYAFHSCIKLKYIKYNGCRKDWYEIRLGNKWNENIPCKIAQCLDGDVYLNEYHDAIGIFDNIK